MFRRLLLIVRHWSLSVREAWYTFRGWTREWLFVLSTPVREFRPRAWAVMLYHGVREVLAMGRAVRPRELGSELVTGSRETVQGVRSSFGVAVGTVFELFWIIVWLPWHFVRLCYHGPIRLWYFLRSRSKRQLLYITVGTVIVVGGTAGVPAYLFLEHRRSTRISIHQRQYDFYVLGNDVAKLEEVLESLTVDMPDDAGLARKLAMVRDRVAPVTEPNLVRFFMRHHLANGRIDESVREANKLLESFPEDWEARCHLAKVALSRGDRAEAKKRLVDLPTAKQAGGAIPPYVAMDAFYLFGQLELRDRVDDVVEFITLNILTDLRAKEMVHLPTLHKLFLIQCYYIALTQLDKRPWLTKYWVPVQQACQSIMDDPTTAVPMLLTVGQAQQNHIECLQTFLRKRLVSPDEFNGLAIDLLGRQKALWEEVLRRDAKNSRGYIGLALYYSWIGNHPAAEVVLTRGLKECGAAPDLVSATGELLARTDPQRGLAFLETALRDEDLTPRMCIVVDKVATQAGRPDRALAACRKALEQDPTLYWARLRIGELCIDLGRPTEAAAAFEPMKAELAKDPKGCGLYVRALCDCGSQKAAEEFLEKVTAADCPIDVLLHAAKGLQAAQRPAETVRWAKRALEKEPLNVEALKYVADNQRVLADTEAGWNKDLARDALQSYRTVERLQPDDLKVVNNIVWLELKALRLPREAYESAAKLRAIQTQVGVPAEYLETLGEVYIGVEQYEQAVAVLRNALATAGGRFSFYLHLGLAYHGLKQYSLAEQYLQKAAEVPNKSKKELEELFEAGRTIYRR
jgi:tetratricopeptide (TPR) repeat protein